MSLFDLAVIIPAWNERENIEDLVPAVQKVTDGLGIRAQIIVVDGGSHDGTAEAAERLGARALSQRERGYGGALLAGFESVAAPYVVTMDADLSHPPTFIADLWARREQAELIIASRYVPGGKAVMSRSRRVLSGILNSVFRMALRLPVRDLSSGFRLYRQETLKQLHLHSRDFDVLEEILVLVYRQGWRVLEVPFQYMPRQSGSSHAKLIRFGWAYLKTLARMWRLRKGG
ncbi:MAG: glycosyltransferase [Bryobacteraceae bacterium]